MANKDRKWDDNITGKFYVDQECIDCDLCRDIASAFFARNEDKGYSYVYRQPKTVETIGQCMEALENCPVEAIGDDGEG